MKPTVLPSYASPFGRPLFILIAAGCAILWALRVAGLCGMGPAGGWSLPLVGWSLPVVGWSLPLGGLGLLLVLVGLGNFYAPSGIYGRPLLRGATNRPLVALTFDDGPDPLATPAVLEVLRRHDAQATFFVIGERAARHPELLAAMARAGHQIENHSLKHGWATPFLPRQRLAADLTATQNLIEAACGRAPRWFRPPIGILSPAVSAAARLVGLKLCAWSCKSRDGLSSTTVPQALARLREGLSPGAILLLHDAAERDSHQPIAPAVLEQLLPLCAERGLRPVTLDELIAD